MGTTTDQRPDWLSRIAALVAVVISITSLGLHYTQTPLFKGARPQLSYYFTRSNSEVTETSNEGELVLFIKNDSKYPAKNVGVLIESFQNIPHEGDVVVKTNRPIKTHDVGNQKYVEFELVPADSIAEATFTIRFTKPSDTKFWALGWDYWKEAPFVREVSHEFGTIKCDHQKCHSTIITPSWGAAGI